MQFLLCSSLWLSARIAYNHDHNNSNKLTFYSNSKKKKETGKENTKMLRN